MPAGFEVTLLHSGFKPNESPLKIKLYRITIEYADTMVPNAMPRKNKVYWVADSPVINEDAFKEAFGAQRDEWRFLKTSAKLVLFSTDGYIKNGGGEHQVDESSMFITVDTNEEIPCRMTERDFGTHKRVKRLPKVRLPAEYGVFPHVFIQGIRSRREILVPCQYSVWYGACSPTLDVYLAWHPDPLNPSSSDTPSTASQ